MKKIYILFLAGLAALWSCSTDLLDIPNPNAAQVDLFWTTASDARAGINACYSTFYKPAAWTQWLSFRYDLTSDEGWSPSPWIELAEWTRFNYTRYDFSEGNNMHWEHFYMAIFRTNQVIKNVPGIDMDANEKKQILAQAYFLRALWYFQINLLWEKGTIVLEPVEADYNPEDASEAEIWEQIETDLAAALANDGLPESWPKTDVGRVTKGAAKALLAKAYMQQHKWPEAKAELEWIIGKEGTLYGLMADRMDNFTHYNENNKESILEIQYDDTNRGGTGNNASMRTSFSRTRFYAPNTIGWADGKARRWLVDEFLKEKQADGISNDLRLYHSVLYKDVVSDFPNESPMYYSVNLSTGGWDAAATKWGNDSEDCYIRKYQRYYFRTSEDNFAQNNFRLIRYADILLCYAECIMETGGTTADAAVYVDKVRERAGMNKLAGSMYSSSLASKDAFMKRLQMERSLELCFECWRWADLKRWGLLDTQAGIDELKARDPDFNNFTIGKNRRMPIPQVEVDNSGGKLTQNPNY